MDDIMTKIIAICRVLLLHGNRYQSHTKKSEVMKMYHHNLKIQERFVKPILENKKRFEIRNNDRCFQNGDLISFTVVNNNNIEEDSLHDKYYEFERTDFEITYIISGWGLKNGYVVLGFKER